MSLSTNRPLGLFTIRHLPKCIRFLLRDEPPQIIFIRIRQIQLQDRKPSLGRNRVSRQDTLRVMLTRRVLLTPNERFTAQPSRSLLLLLHEEMRRRVTVLLMTQQRRNQTSGKKAIRRSIRSQGRRPHKHEHVHWKSHLLRHVVCVAVPRYLHLADVVVADVSVRVRVVLHGQGEFVQHDADRGGVEYSDEAARETGCGRREDDGGLLDYCECLG